MIDEKKVSQTVMMKNLMADEMELLLVDVEAATDEKILAKHISLRFSLFITSCDYSGSQKS